MDEARFADEYARIDLHVKLEKDLRIVPNYETALAGYRQSVQETQYRLGRLDERLDS